MDGHLKNECDIIKTLYHNVLQRKPNPNELAFWVKRWEENALQALQKFFDAPETKKKMCAQGAQGAHAPGHFYSPVIDPAQISREKLAKDLEATEIEGIDINLQKQREIWQRFCDLPEEAVVSGVPRYTPNNPVYGAGDAQILRSMMRVFRPSRIIEIGSGFSSACMLDTAEAEGMNTHFTFIDPDLARARLRLRESDLTQHSVIEQQVQNVDLEVFRELGRNDFLFVDSSHVMKAQSDVNYELFEILPSLSEGVIIHFHDCFWPFEYPAEWMIERGYSWNELYGLRAFLSYNSAFEILFFNTAFITLSSSAVKKAPDYLRSQYKKNTGGGLWIRKYK